MVFLPFIHFTLLTLYWWRKHEGFDICVYMSSLYAFCSLCAIFLVYGNMLETGGILFDETDIELNFVPTLFYISLLTLSLLPFSLIHGKDLKEITIGMKWIIDLVSWMFIALSLLNFYLVADSTLDILGGDLEAVRQAHYEGVLTPAQIKAESIPAIFRYFYYLNISTLLALPLFFYYLCFGNKPWWFKSLLIFASLSVPLMGIQAADRTEFVFYALMFLYCLVFFRKMLSRKTKRIMAFIGVPFTVLMLVYLIAVSMARFDEKEGAGTVALQYAGQGYLNFCFFWENGKFDDIATEREFPLINHTFAKIDSNPERRAARSGHQGFYISVFATFIGDIMLDISPVGVTIWVIYYFLLVFLVIKSPHRKEMSIGEVMLLYGLAIIPVFGIFYYKLYTYHYTYMLILTAGIYAVSRLKLVCK